MTKRAQEEKTHYYDDKGIACGVHYSSIKVTAHRRKVTCLRCRATFSTQEHRDE